MVNALLQAVSDSTKRGSAGMVDQSSPVFVDHMKPEKNDRFVPGKMIPLNEPNDSYCLFGSSIAFQIFAIQKAGQFASD